MFRLLLLCVLCVSGLAVGQEAQDPASDNLEGVDYRPLRGKAHTVYSEIVGQAYELRVGVPNDYYAEPNADFPVVYVLDGQWDYTIAGDLQGKLIYDGMMPQAIIVGITWAGDNADYSALRQRDFTFTENPGVPGSGGAQLFLKALEQEIIPFTEMLYRANGHRTLIGSSLGGLFSTYAMLAKPGLFSGHVALSAPYSLEQSYLDQRIAELSGSKALAGIRLYIGVGEYDPNNRQVLSLAHQLRRARLKGLHMRKKVLPQLGHTGATSVGYTYGFQYVFERPKLKLGFAALNVFAGTYLVGPDYPALTVEPSNHGLTLTQQGSADVIKFYAETETCFYAPGINLSIEFVVDDNDVMTLLLNNGGNQIIPFIRQ